MTETLAGAGELNHDVLFIVSWSGALQKRGWNGRESWLGAGLVRQGASGSSDNASLLPGAPDLIICDAADLFLGRRRFHRIALAGLRVCGRLSTVVGGRRMIL